MYRSLIVFAALVLFPSSASAQLQTEVYVTGLSAPVVFVQDPTQPNVQLIAELAGRVRVIRDAALLEESFLDLRDVVVSGGERGLLGLVFAPDYATSRRFFVNFTGAAGHTVIARFLRHADNPLRADPDSRFDLVFPAGQSFIHQPYTNHNGGDLHFGPDGFLYIGLGDGGSGNDPQNLAQNLDSLLGKMLRLDVDVPDTDPLGYRVPADNPFHGDSVSTRSLIWALGLRNPWRFTFDLPRAGGSGALIIADVGQSAWEEVNYEPAGRGGRNYGWRIREGAHPNTAYNDPTTEGLTDPVVAYSHAVGRSITGGPVYRGTDLGTAFFGRYFFGDITGRVWSAGFTLGADAEVVEADVQDHTDALGGPSALGFIVTFGVDASCRLYIVNLGGSVLRVTSTAGAQGDGCGSPLPFVRPACVLQDARIHRMPQEAIRRFCERRGG